MYEERREAIASLTGHRGYRFLLEELGEGVNVELLAAMASAKTDDQLLRVARVWQVTYKFWSYLNSEPHKVRHELEHEQQAALEEAKYQMPEGAPPFPIERQKLLEQLENIADSTELNLS
jgi:hypothetical protein